MSPKYEFVFEGKQWNESLKFGWSHFVKKSAIGKSFFS